METEKDAIWAERGERDFVDKLIYASTANHYNPLQSGSLHAVPQNKSTYLKILI
jgi:hypothetical protein